MKKAKAATEENRAKELRKNALNVAKEFAMLSRWLQEVTRADLLTDEQIKIWLAQMLKDYPLELKKVLEYSDKLKEYAIKGNFLGFQVKGNCIEESRLWLSVNWAQMEFPTE